MRAATAPLRLAERGIPPLSSPDGATFTIDVPCEVQALILDRGSDRLVLIGADLLWFSDALTDQLRPEIAATCGVAHAAVALTATHTHGASQPDLRFDMGAKREALCDEIISAVTQAVADALESAPTEVTLSRAVAHAAPDLSVHRRRRAWYLSRQHIGRRVQNLPNGRHPIDRRLTTLAFRRADGAPAAIVNHFTCHGVADPTGVGGADYPGYLRQALQAKLGVTLPVLFLQGFCGDIRPNLRLMPSGLKSHVLQQVIGPRFRPSAEGDSRRIGQRLSAYCLDGLDHTVPIDIGAITLGQDRIPLHGISGARLDRDLQVTTWRLGDDCQLVFASGEMLSGLAPDDGVLSVGYANGMAGYVAPPEAYADGGYEIDGFRPAMALDERIDPRVGPDYLRVRAILLESLAQAA